MIKHPIHSRCQFTVKYKLIPKLINFLLTHFQEEMVPDNLVDTVVIVKLSISRKLVKAINIFKFDGQLTGIQALKKLLLILIEFRLNPPI